ncbi:MAG: hypothetical protein ABF649_21130 [Bacillus sp. (in: firmicutes)]|uniref:hypothetical protein n=1 Tax=Sporolactobacillus sp. STSJ-5 TaxID=2965076 RepID=UPI002107A2D6|nr:hypothetical protein [Sporolactobacillus sp. STSJ-5]MCQ2009179.1 hypothetical protein [Sporolactobacillus sp. STSJ-5]
MIRGPLELFRVLLLVAIFGSLVSSGIVLIYHLMHLSVGGWGYLLVFLATLMFIFVLYRNRLQFNGFFLGRQRRSLPEWQTRTLIIIAIFLIVIAPIV